MSDEQEPPQYAPSTNAFKTLLDRLYIHRLPPYGNSIFYGLGFMALTCLLMLAATGTFLAFMGQNWWLSNPLGIYVRSVHLWSVQAFMAVLVLHITVVFLTSGFKPPRRMVWVFGATIFCLALIQTEFGYTLRGDFGSQYRAVSGADFWNGSYLGHWINPLNFIQAYSIHVFIIPFVILVLFIAHYLLEHTYGIALPYRKDLPQKTVPADHRVMYARGVALVLLILIMAFFFHSPYVAPLRIAGIAQQNPSLVAATLQQEYDRTSDTATYLDSIDPYTFDTRQVFVIAPYNQYSAAGAFVPTADPTSMIQTLVPLVQSGLYESLLNQEEPTDNDTYRLRFLNDMDVLEPEAIHIGLNTANWGMAKDVTGNMIGLPPGSWWFLPLGITNSTFNLLQNPNGDRDAAGILGFTMFIFILFPYIPWLNRLPEFLRVAPLIWRERK